ncbi:MAG: tetratricopeptide repeat protein [Bacteroidota bacterium]
MRRLSLYILPVVIFTAALLSSCGKKAEENSDIPITTTSEEARAAFIEGRDALEVGRSEQARAAFDRALAADPSFALACVYRARTATSASDWKEWADKAIANRENTSAGEKILLDSFAAMLDDDIQQELNLAQQLVKAYPKSARAQIELADAYSGMENIEEARAAMLAAAELDPTWALPHNRLAVSFIFDEPRDLSKAESEASRYVELKPGEADAHITLGDVYRAQLDLEKARNAYAKAAEVDPTSAVAFSKKGHADTFLGNYDAARSDYSSAVEKSDRWKIGGKNFAVYTWLYAGDINAALAANQSVIDAAPSLISDPGELQQALNSCYEDRCRIAIEARAFAVAAEAMVKHTELSRELATIVKNEAYTASTEGQLAVLGGLMALRQGKLIDASALADSAERMLREQSNPRAMNPVHFLRGLIAMEEGNPTSAISFFDSSGDDMIEVKYYKALALEALGENDKAAKLFQAVVDWNFNDLNYALVRGKAEAKLKS